jgi:NDP-sugar pyrophosphorylase family protein
MAGNGSRFSQAGFLTPKPFIDIKGKPMILRVIENLNFIGKYIFIVKSEHYIEYDLENLFSKIGLNYEIIQVDKPTEGTVCSVLLAKKLINNDQSLIIANSDQFLEWDPDKFLKVCKDSDACISTFLATGNKWSYVKLNDFGLVDQVAEKNPISQIATTGIYFWKYGKDFVKYAEQMISKNIRVNNEFYVCPVFNEAILDNKKIRISFCDKMWGLGTPEDLYMFTNQYYTNV